MATGPTNSSSSKKVYAQKLPNNSQTTSRIPHPTLPQRRFHTVASDDDSSSHSRLPYIGTGNSLPGYVKFDDKVRISLNAGSKSVIRELKRKLVSELDQVRTLKKKLEAKEIDDYSNYNNNRVGTLARVNSEVSYVGPTNSGQLQGVAVNNNTSSHRENLDKDRKASKVNNKKDKALNSEKISTSDNKNKLKACNGVKKAGGGNAMHKFNGEILKKCEDLLEKLMKHQYGWVFNKPVDVKKLKLHDYCTIIKHPMDLGTVKTRLKKNWYKSPKAFAEDVRLTFNNAMKYNEKGQDVHAMADVLIKLFEEKWAGMETKFNYVKRLDARHAGASLPAPATKGASALLPKVPSETRMLARSGSMPNLMDSDISAHEGRTTIAKDSKTKDPPRREMTFEEKQRLSTDLLNLPSDKLDSVVQIIRKRNPGLCQHEDEIEVDIDSFDSETLWELDRLVINYKNKRIDEPMVQARGAGHNIQETSLTFDASEAPEEFEAVQKFVVTSPVQREKQGDNVSRSSSSSSSSGASGSSSSDSGSDSSSGYGSDAGQ